MHAAQKGVQAHQWKALNETFRMIWLNIGLSRKITKIRITPLFFKIDLCSATSMESSRRDLLNDMAEHRPISKNNQNMNHLRFGFTPKAVIIPHNGFFCFYFALIRWQKR